MSGDSEPEGAQNGRLRARFMRTGESRDVIEVELPGGGSSAWKPVTRGADPPRDLVLLLAEGALGLTDGFWGRLLEGTDLLSCPPKATSATAAGLSPQAAAGLARAGAILGAVIHATADGSHDSAALARTISAACARVGASAPVSLGPEACAHVLSQVQAAARRWNALPAGASLSYSFPT